MSTIKINDEEYDVETLSDEAKNQLASIEFVDAELSRLQAKTAVLQTARIAYVKELSKIVSNKSE
jgi:cell division protein ZapA (FtsZ GTPase activity inhibitor)